LINDRNILKILTRMYFEFLPEEIISLIFDEIEPIKQYCLSQVCQLFTKILYRNRPTITNIQQYCNAINKGDILSIVKNQFKFWDNEPKTYASLLTSISNEHDSNWQKIFKLACLKGEKE